MSLNRYINVENLKSVQKPQYGNVFIERDLENFDSKLYIPKLTDLSNPVDLISEIHIYTLNGDYLGSAYDSEIIVDRELNSLYVDVKRVFSLANIERGTYKIAINLLSPLFGRPTLDKSKNNFPVFLKEISPDRTELKLTLKDPARRIELQEFREYMYNLSSFDILNNICINFNDNILSRITNVRFDPLDQNTFYVKAYTPIDDIVEELDSAWFAIELADSYIDTVTLIVTEEDAVKPKLRGPRWDIDVDQWDSHATIYKSWHDLLDSNEKTAQEIIDASISGSAQATLNIDYTDFSNYIFYSSAEERIRNFYYKMELIESYSLDNNILSGSLSNDTSFVKGSIQTNTDRIDKLISTFDSFERWMYYADTGSLFTHDISGSMTPWPKYIDNSQYITHSPTSSIALQWLNETTTQAAEFDRLNQNSLYWSIPEHILMEPNNSEYITFVNMIGQHFDVMYTYVKALTSIHEKDEHPQRGASNDLLFHIAKSFGWNLQNSRELSELWLYKLGKNQDGELLESSGLKVQSHESQTQQIWKRIVNNLPYLLKTKGTSRSVKALMSIYGIPKTLLSIKEYGGPGLDSDKPIAIEDRFTYALNVDSNSYLKIPQDSISAYEHGWGTGAWCGITDPGSLTTRTPDTYEFRFSTRQSGSLDALRLFTLTSGSSQDVKLALSLVSSVELDASSSISGSENYGKVLIETFGATPQYEYSEYIPIFDGDMWTVRVFNETPYSGSDINNRIEISKASDCLYGRISHITSVSMSADQYEIDTAWYGGGSGSAFINSNTQTPHDFTNESFQGQLQSYREYYTLYSTDTFKNHVLNPGAYNVDSISGSFYSLYRYYPLGLDLQREDHTTYLFASSSQPDQTQTPTPAEFVGFTGTQQTQYTILNETFYAEVPKLGGFVLNGQKIRIEDNELKYELSPDVKSEISQFDDAPLDSRKLAIVFSQTDQVNRDISDHMGFGDLDEFIGSPEYEFESTYNTLHNKKNEYFQKYQQKNDINTFIRILGFYDYTFFEQIKQLVPGRADLISGILIEPHILQRSKIQLTKLPIVTNPQYSDTIEYIVTQSGKFPTYEGIIDNEPESIIEHFYETASIEYDPESLIHHFYETGSIDEPFIAKTHIQEKLEGCVNMNDAYDFSHSEFVKTKNAHIEVIDKYNGFKSGSIELIVTQSRLDCRYSKKVRYYNAYLIQNSLFEESNFSDLTPWTTTGTVTLVSESLNINNTQKDIFKKGVLLESGSSINQIVDTEQDVNYILIYHAAPIDSGSTSSNLIFETNNDIFAIEPIRYGVKDELRWINRYELIFTGSITDDIAIYADSDTTIYTMELYRYLQPWEAGWIANSYRTYNLEAFNVLEPTSYQIDETSPQNNSRFKGSKLSGPGINIDSPDTIDGGPVVEIRQTNPNSLFTKERDESGNLRVE